jgi:hypothetical protein
VEGAGAGEVGVAATSVAVGALVGVAGSGALVAVAGTGDAVGCGGTAVQAASVSAKINSTAGIRQSRRRGVEIGRTVITFRLENAASRRILYRAESRHLP